MSWLEQSIKISFAAPVLIIIAAFFLHALQVPHHHFISLESNSQHSNHHHQDTAGDSNSLPGNLVGLPDYLHGADKKDLLTLLLTLASLAGVIFLGWPQTLVRVEQTEIFRFKLAVEKIPLILYLRLLFSQGILNPMVH